MHLQSITLTNVRQFQGETFRFQPGFNLLVGENGAGKTTLLRSILAVLGSAKQTGRRPALDEDDVRVGALGLRIEAELADADNNIVSALHYEKELGARARRSTDRDDLVLLYASNEASCGSFVGRRIKRYGTSDLRDIRSREEAIFEIERGTDPENSPEVRFGRSRTIRAFVLNILSSFSEDFRDFAWSFEPYDCAIRPPPNATKPPQSFAPMRRTFANAILRYLQQRKERFRWPDQARIIFDSKGVYVGPKKLRVPSIPALRELLRPAEPDSRTVEYLEACTIELRLTPRIVIRSRQGDLLLHQLSDGQQRLFSIFADIARQLTILPRPGRIYQAEAIVLIDEIDVHLHPMWQRKIVPALEQIFSSCQFIATTHSPFIVQATQEGQVQQIDGSAIGDVANRGIEEIAAKVMHVEAEAGRRYIQMLNAAKEYLRAVETTSRASHREIAALRTKLSELSGRYARNPAYQAFLELKTEGKFGSGD